MITEMGRRQIKLNIFLPFLFFTFESAFLHYERFIRDINSFFQTQNIFNNEYPQGQ